MNTLGFQSLGFAFDLLLKGLVTIGIFFGASEANPRNTMVALNGLDWYQIEHFFPRTFNNNRANPFVLMVLSLGSMMIELT